MLGAESKSIFEGELRLPRRAPVLPTQQASSSLDLTGDLSVLMENEEQELMRIKAVQQCLRLHRRR